MSYDWLVVGAGFAGSVLAERLASQLGRRVLVVDRRPHIGGNAYDERDAAGVLVHRYGPHIFHTNAPQIVRYLSRFTEWRPYEHRVLARVRDQLLPIPIDRTTLNRLYGLDLATDEAVAGFLAARAEPVAHARTSEDVVVGTVGRELYELFFRGYTRKQWGLDPCRLDASVTARIPTRTNEDDRYFTDRFQAMPRHGYSAMFARMHGGAAGAVSGRPAGPTPASRREPRPRGRPERRARRCDRGHRGVPPLRRRLVRGPPRHTDPGTGEPFEVPVGHTVWYRFTGTGEPMTIDTAGSDFDTVVAIYTLDGEELVPVPDGCVDDSPIDPIGRTLQANVTIPTVEGTTYYVQVGGYPEVIPYGTLKVSLR